MRAQLNCVGGNCENKNSSIYDLQLKLKAWLLFCVNIGFLPVTYYASVCNCTDTD